MFLTKLATARFVSRMIFCLGMLLALSGCEQKNVAYDNPQNGIFRKTREITERKDECTRPVKILFVGDMMFDRYIRTAVGKYGKGNYEYVFEPIKEKLAEQNLVVGNLEGPITGKKSVSAETEIGGRGNFVFTFDPAVTKTLARNNIKLVNLGNNHILNQGKDGLIETKKYLAEVGVEYFGDENFLIKEIEGVKVGFVSYNYSVANSLEKTLEKIGEIRDKVDFLIVCPHWGMEYKIGDPGQQTKSAAYEFIYAGADLVIGTHPHVVQISEIYKGKKIYYSFGNFVFDQYFQKETMEGLGVELTINPDCTLEYNELKFVMNRRGQTELMQNKDQN